MGPKISTQFPVFSARKLGRLARAYSPNLQGWLILA